MVGFGSPYVRGDRPPTSLPGALVVGTITRVAEVALSVVLTVVIPTITRIVEVATAGHDVVVVAGAGSRCDSGGRGDVDRGQADSAH